MFTGIVEGTGTLLTRTSDRFVFTHPFAQAFAVGESICCSGMCATVLTSDAAQFTVQIIEQSQYLTTFGAMAVTASINLERSAVVGSDRNAGHYVTGHIDHVARVLRVERRTSERVLTLALPAAYAHWVVPRGSVTLGGVALTVAEVTEGEYTVHVIDHTWAVTTLGQLTEGAQINVEYDIMAKYATRRAALDVYYDHA